MASGVAGDGVDEPRRPGGLLASPTPSASGASGSGRGRQSSPGHLPGQAQLVEPARVVAEHPGGQDMPFPLARRHLDALELFDDGEQAGPTLGLGPGGHVLPAGEEPDQVGDGRRLDVPPAAAAAGGVEPDQQMAGTPPTIGQLDGRAARLQPGQAGPGPGLGDRGARAPTRWGADRRPPVAPP